jgi:hypothetical protein
MDHTRRATLPALLLAALLASSCGEDSITLPDVAVAAYVVTVDPNPVPPSQNPLTGSVSVGYRVTITEVNGLGGEVNFVASAVFDPETGQRVAFSYFDSADLVVFIGQKRIEPFGTLVVPQTISYFLPDFRVPATLTVLIQAKDDRGNLVNESVLVKIE